MTSATSVGPIVRTPGSSPATKSRGTRSNRVMNGDSVLRKGTYSPNGTEVLLDVRLARARFGSPHGPLVERRLARHWSRRPDRRESARRRLLRPRSIRSKADWSSDRIDVRGVLGPDHHVGSGTVPARRRPSGCGGREVTVQHRFALTEGVHAGARHVALDDAQQGITVDGGERNHQPAEHDRTSPAARTRARPVPVARRIEPENSHANRLPANTTAKPSQGHSADAKPNPSSGVTCE